MQIVQFRNSSIIIKNYFAPVTHAEGERHQDRSGFTPCLSGSSLAISFPTRLLCRQGYRVLNYRVLPPSASARESVAAAGRGRTSDLKRDTVSWDGGNSFFTKFACIYQGGGTRDPDLFVGPNVEGVEAGRLNGGRDLG